MYSSAPCHNISLPAYHSSCQDLGPNTPHPLTSTFRIQISWKGKQESLPICPYSQYLPMYLLPPCIPLKHSNFLTKKYLAHQPLQKLPTETWQSLSLVKKKSRHFLSNFQIRGKMFRGWIQDIYTTEYILQYLSFNSEYFGEI